MSTPGGGPMPMLRMDEWQRMMEEMRREFRNQSEIIAGILSRKHLPTYGLLSKAEIRRRLPIIMEVLTIYIDETIEVMNTMWTIAQIDMRIAACFKWEKRTYKRKKRDSDEETTYTKLVKTELVYPEDYSQWRHLRKGPITWLEQGRTMLASCRMIFDTFGDLAIVQAWREKTDKEIASVFGITPEAMEKYGEIADKERADAAQDGDKDMVRMRKAQQEREGRGGKSRITSLRRRFSGPTPDEEAELLADLELGEDEVFERHDEPEDLLEEEDYED